MSNFQTISPATGGQQGTNPTIYSACTTDSLATILTTGYLEDRYYLFKPQDILFIRYADGVGSQAGGIFEVLADGESLVQLVSADTVQGPVSSTNNAIARWDGTTGTLLQDSPVQVDDDGDIIGAAGVNCQYVNAEQSRSGLVASSAFVNTASVANSHNYVISQTISTGGNPAFVCNRVGVGYWMSGVYAADNKYHIAYGDLTANDPIMVDEDGNAEVKNNLTVAGTISGMDVVDTMGAGYIPAVSDYGKTFYSSTVTAVLTLPSPGGLPDGWYINLYCDTASNYVSIADGGSLLVGPSRIYPNQGCRISLNPAGFFESSFITSDALGATLTQIAPIILDTTNLAPNLNLMSGGATAITAPLSADLDGPYLYRWYVFNTTGGIVTVTPAGGATVWGTTNIPANTRAIISVVAANTYFVEVT